MANVQVENVKRGGGRGRDFTESRVHDKCNVSLKFEFIARIYGNTMNRIVSDLENSKTPFPDVIILHSCLWDLTRWGPNMEGEYKKQMLKLFVKLRNIAKENTLIIWLTMPPVSKKVKGGCIIQQLDFIPNFARYIMMEANTYAIQLCKAFGIDVLDIHYHLRYQLYSRANDGLHWETHALRFVTNLILTHISLAIDVPLPGNINTEYLNNCIRKAQEASNTKEISVSLDKETMKIVEAETKKIEQKIKDNRVIKKARRRFN